MRPPKYPRPATRSPCPTIGTPPHKVTTPNVGDEDAEHAFQYDPLFHPVGLRGQRTDLNGKAEILKTGDKTFGLGCCLVDEFERVCFRGS